MAPIDTSVLRATADLARLQLSDDEAARMASRLGDVLAHFAALDAVDTTGVEPTFVRVAFDLLPTEPPPAQILTQAEVLANAPLARDGAFVVPRMVER